MNEHEARNIADDGFGYIAARPELVSNLLAQTGSTADSLRKMAARPEFGVFILDFLLERDDLVVDFASSAGLKPERVVIARAVLGGGDPW